LSKPLLKPLMSMRPAVRRLSIALVALAVLALALFVAWQFALQRLQGALLQALGPRATVEALDVGWGHVEVRGLRIRGDRQGALKWPADDELRAERVTLRPDLGALFSGRWRVGAVDVHKPYLSLLRTRDGKLHVLPALVPPAPPPGAAGATATANAAAAPLVLIDHIRLHDAEIELFDASVKRPAHRIRLAQVQAEVADLRLPALDAPLALKVDGVFKGPQRDGQLHIAGTLTPAPRDAALKASFSNVDLVALQPYLFKGGEGSVKRGSLDLRLQADVRHNQLKAPGTVTLRQVELGGSGLGALSQRAVLAAMDREGRVEVDFVLAGKLDDPKFSLNEDLAAKVAVGLAEKLGLSIGGVAEGLGSVVKGLFGR
jgi:hypothetical protein